MQPSSPRFSRPTALVCALGLLAVGCLLGACDRHRADDLPESYGHGSSHEKAFNRHENDSLDGSRHFSDSKGLTPGEAHSEASPAPEAKPGETASGRMFPNN